MQRTMQTLLHTMCMRLVCSTACMVAHQYVERLFRAVQLPAHTSIRMSVRTSLRMSLHMSVHMLTHGMYAHIFRAHVCTHVWTHAHTHVDTWIRAHVYLSTHMSLPPCRSELLSERCHAQRVVNRGKWVGHLVCVLWCLRQLRGLAQGRSRLA